MTKKYRFRLPFSTLAVATAENPLLLEGEVWREKNATTGQATGRTKTGDGVTVFTSLPFDPGGTGGGDAASVSFTPAGTIAATNVQAAIEELDGDSRMSNSRTPTAHATSHGSGGSDPVTLAQSQVTGLTTALAAKADTSSLATVATTGAYGDLTGRPTLGTAASQNVGTSAGNVVQLDGSARLPAVDGSQLTGLPGGGGATNLSIANRGTTTLDVASDTGTDATIPAATTSLTGLLTSADKTKLDGIATGATANATDAALRDRATHTGTQGVATITGLGSLATLSALGNITSAGAIGSTANLPVITTTGGALTVGSFGTTANTFCQGNDARLSDARTPTAHNQAWSTITSTPTTLSGYGITDAQPLDSDLTSIAALTTTTFGRNFLDRADAAAGRTHLGLGTLATQSGTFSGTSSGTNTGDQTIANSSDATSHTVTLSASGGTVQFVEGSNITLTTTGTSSAGVVTIAATGGGGGSLTVQDEGTNLSTSVTTINFTGSGVTATGTSTVTVDIPGGGGGISDGDKGDITVSGSGATWTIDNGAVTLGKIVNFANQRLPLRNSAGSGPLEEGTLSQLLDWGSSTHGAILYRGASSWISLPPIVNQGLLATDGTGGTRALEWLETSIFARADENLSQFTSTNSTSAMLRGMINDETGTGSLVFNTSPTFVTPALGTPSSGTLTNCTGLPTSGITNFNANTRAQTEAMLVAGANVTLTPAGSGATRTLTIATSGGGNSFSTIAVSGQSDVVADSSANTLTLVAGANVTITTNAGTDTVTIAASGGGGGSLSDGDKGDITVSSAGSVWRIDNEPLDELASTMLATQLVPPPF